MSTMRKRVSLTQYCFTIIFFVLCGLVGLSIIGSVFTLNGSGQEAEEEIFKAPTSYYKQAKAVCEQSVIEVWGYNLPSFEKMVAVCANQIAKYSQELGYWPTNQSATFAPSSTWSQSWDVANKVYSKFVDKKYSSEDDYRGDVFVRSLSEAILSK